MCTLIALHRCVPGAHLVVAANRDEALDRPASGPACRATAHGPVVAPRDEKAGGTWWGINAAGIFAAITNRPAPAPDPQRRSRGLLVLDALACGSAQEALRWASELPTETYNPFNLFVADERDSFAVVYEDKPRCVSLAPGAHVVGNADPDAREVPKIARLLARSEAVSRGAPERVLEGLAEICRTHEPSADPLASVCIHGAHYGTRSSTLLWLDASAGWLRHAEGAPCRTDYRDFTPLLERLRPSTASAPVGSYARGAS